MVLLFKKKVYCFMLSFLPWGFGGVTYGYIEDEEHLVELMFGDHEDVDIYSHDVCRETYIGMISLYCWTTFHAVMMVAQEKNWCQWPLISSIYSDLTNCTEFIAEAMACIWPSPEVETFFLQIHMEYFAKCSPTLILYGDPPASQIITMTLVPICLMPLVLYLIVWKNSGPNT
ncbi:receptor activity-modifying protein 1-like [Rhinatrema bivittatum]|uniref:receptor activity-modifying protein 1-like n=1 Tax=Rhinatrema bivittatum TaxID=194408 RepID=UPI0011284AD5|nr:receptor activity-modifying protein 1-like [Rhinatrema bivittatum]